MPYVESICRAGKTVEIKRYYTRIYKKESKKRNIKSRPTSQAQENVNKRKLEEKLTRLLNANFDESSYYLTFSYRVADRPATKEDIKTDQRKLLSDLRKIYKKNNKVLKYVETPEIGKRGAAHFHIVINNINIDEIKKVWKKGFIKIIPLDSSGQYKKLAAYFIKYFYKTKNTEKEIQGKAYNCSRNLKRPKIIKHIIQRKYFKKAVKIPKGYYLDKETYTTGINADGREYLIYTIIKKT